MFFQAHNHSILPNLIAKKVINEYDNSTKFIGCDCFVFAFCFACRKCGRFYMWISYEGHRNKFYCKRFFEKPVYHLYLLFYGSLIGLSVD